MLSIDGRVPEVLKRKKVRRKRTEGHDNDAGVGDEVSFFAYFYEALQGCWGIGHMHLISYFSYLEKQSNISQ